MTRVPPRALLAAALAAAPLGAQTPRAAYEELQALSGTLTHVRLNYVDSVAFGALVRAAIDGMLRSLDPHSHYYSRVEWERQNALERGELAITGVVVDHVDGAITVLAVTPRSPAARAGVLPGDRIVAIADSSVAGLDVGDVRLRLAGEKGSRVRVTLERGSRLEPDSLRVALRRDFLEHHSVSLVRLAAPGVGYLRLEEFGPEAGREVHDALRRLRGQRASAVILDLRGNPGGLVTAAVEIAQEFFPKGTLVFRSRGRKRDANAEHVTEAKGDFVDLPLVVLLNEHSASASEALAASLQDHDRALIVGRRSFGKALVQTGFLVAPVGDLVMLTIAHIESPSGRVIQRRYRGVGYERYLGLAGTGGAAEDTAQLYRTDAGRTVRGGGGVRPDVTLPPAPPLPVWISAAIDSGFDTAVADSVATTLPGTAAARAAWVADAASWRDRLLPPFLARARSRLGVSAATDSVLERRIAFHLAARAAEVRWGAEAREELLLTHDAAVRTAVEHIPRLGELLGPPRP
jgi:carboxyl-terminal processing protease